VQNSIASIIDDLLEPLSPTIRAQQGLFSFKEFIFYGNIIPQNASIVSDIILILIINDLTTIMLYILKEDSGKKQIKQMAL
jgi:hypothetical protein